MEGECLDEAAFRAHVELLRAFLARRDQIVERIQEQLNAQRKPAQLLQDTALLARRFEDCFFPLAAMTPEHSRLRGQLQALHWASGFRPRNMPGMYNDLIQAAEMMVRGFHFWRKTRWPGRSGRVRFAQTLFNLHLIRCLELLSMRLWDCGSSGAGDRLSQVQELLDRLWKGAPADQPVIVRDARWLIPIAQSPTTDELRGYFEVAERVAETLPAEDSLEILKASVELAGGHLRSQLRHYLMKGGSLDEKSLILSSRDSNALDFSMLVQGLVPLLGAYEQACRDGDRRKRIELASAICQGISADPELFVNRTDLLGAYGMIEHVCIATDRDGRAGYTAVGARHVRLLEEYATRIHRSSRLLHEDCSRFRPVPGAYSPYGLIFGYASNLIEHMALKTLQPDAPTQFGLEDVFVEGDSGADKLAWVSGWRKLPHIGEEMQKMFEYPQRFAEEIFNRIETALRRCASDEETSATVRTGRLFVMTEDDAGSAPRVAAIAELPVRYIGSSDPQIVAAQKARSCEETQLLRDRQEGMFLVSYQTSGGWVGITKDLLTELLGAGQDAKITGLPDGAAGVLRLMCRNLLGNSAG